MTAMHDDRIYSTLVLHWPGQQQLRRVLLVEQTHRTIDNNFVVEGHMLDTITTNPRHFAVMGVSLHDLNRGHHMMI